MEHRTLGDYNMVKLIGQGMLGMVFLAEHRFMKKPYLLQVLPEELATDRGFIQRFEEEIGYLASLDHPNIVKIYTASFDQGVYFLVMECIVDSSGETTTLAQYLSGRDANFTESDLLMILKQVASALDYAHSKKVNGQELAHRSLKLSNILVGKSKDKVEVYLSDFGLSRIVGTGAVLTRTFKHVTEALNLASPFSRSDAYPSPAIDDQKLILLHQSFLQNYAFLAPEQRKIQLQKLVGKKADYYAFGVLAYYLLMQELPEGIFEMPSALGLRQFNWDLLINSCLNQNPEKRPASLTKILSEIENPFQEATSFVSTPKQDSQPLTAEGKDTAPSPASFFLKQAPNFALESEPVTITPIYRPEKKEAEIKKEGKETSSFKEVEEPQGRKTPLLKMPKLERPTTDLDPGAVFHVSSAVKTYSPEQKDVANIQPLMTEMAVVEGGAFNRGSKDGSRDEMPRHPISLRSFAIDIHPVTNEQFVRFLEVMGGEKDTNHNDIIRLRDARIKRSGGKLSIESGYSKHPVVGVTWYGAVAYAKWIGKRLPTEAEWEVAARGAQENALYPTGEEIEKNQANFFSSDTTAVMSYTPTSFGLYDMAGNVYEWCQDWYGYNYYETSIQEPDNPKGPLQGVYRVLRGGCWKSLKEDLRCSRRHRNNPGTVNGTYGFRCAADVEEN